MAAPVTRIRAVLFDWGDTLFASPHAPSVIVEGARELGVTVDAETARQVWDEIWSAGKSAEEHAKGRDLSPLAHRKVWTALFDRANRVAAGLDEILYARVMDPAGWIPYADTAPTLRALKARSVKVGIVSNIPRDLRPLFSQHGLGDTVDAYTLSYEQGVAKPDPALFLAAYRELGVPPAETLMVGDDPVTDGGAGAAGLQVYVLPPHDGGPARGLARVVELVDVSRASVTARSAPSPASGA